MRRVPRFAHGLDSWIVRPRLRSPLPRLRLWCDLLSLLNSYTVSQHAAPVCSRHRCRMLHVSYRSCTPRRTLDAAFFARCLLPVVASCLRHPAYRLHYSHSLAAAALLLFGVGFAQSAPPHFARVLWSVAAMNLVHVGYSPISADRRSASHAACTVQPRHIAPIACLPSRSIQCRYVYMRTYIRTFVRLYVRTYIRTHT